MNVKDEIIAYIPYDERQRQNKEKILKMIEENDRILYRDSLEYHFSSSGFIMDETLEYCLMIYHNIYKSFAWTGGHNDGEDDMLKVAVREAQEETGISKILKSAKYSMTISNHSSARKRTTTYRRGFTAMAAGTTPMHSCVRL